jgi:hypothetical protein
MTTMATLDRQTLREMAVRPEWLPVAGSIEAHFVDEVTEKARTVCKFLLPRRGECFPEKTWPAFKLFRYVVWHLLSENLFLSWRDGELCGVAFAWPAIERDVQARAALDEPQFAWKPPVAAGDCVFIAQVVGTRIDGPTWLRLAHERWPELYLTRFWTYRGGQLVEVSYDTLRRFCR